MATVKKPKIKFHYSVESNETGWSVIYIHEFATEKEFFKFIWRAYRFLNRIKFKKHGGRFRTINCSELKPIK